MNLLEKPVGRKRRTKVLHLIAGLETGGTEMMLYKVLSKIDREKIDSKVVVMISPGPVGARIASLGIPVESLGMTRSVPKVTALLHLVKLLRRERPDVLQTWMYHADLLGGIAAKMAGLRRVLWNVRQTANLRGNGALTTAVVLACGLLSRWLPLKIVCNSQAAVRIHERLGYAQRKFCVIPNGFDLDSFMPDEKARGAIRDELRIPRDSTLIGHVARFDPAKDHGNLFAAFGKLATRYPNSYFLCVGRGVTLSNHSLVEMIKAAGISGRCHLLGERSDIPKITAALDLAVSSSFAEGFPNVVGEAMACGVPCVVTRVGDSAHLVGDAGKVVSPGKSDELARAIGFLLDLPPQELRTMGEAGRIRVRTKFDIHGISDLYEELYRDVMTNVRHSGLY